jgi:hypothetical protein
VLLLLLLLLPCCTCRLAMLGFAGMVATEMITGVNVLQAWGLQPLTTLASTINPVTGL